MIYLYGYVNTPKGVQKINWPGWATKNDFLCRLRYEMKYLLLLSLCYVNIPK